MLDPLPHPADFLLVERCLEGEAEAIGELQRTLRPVLIAYLRKAGGTEQEAEEVTDGLWADCLAERAEHSPRLAKYNGECALKTWFYPWALNRLMERKRRQASWGKILQPGLEPEHLEQPEMAEPGEPALLELMREAVEAAFRECPDEDFALLQLAHAGQLQVEELGRMFGCANSSISRNLKKARAGIAAATLRHVRARDPWLELKWEDFLELCRTVSPGTFGME